MKIENQGKWVDANNKFNTWSSCEELFSKHLVNELYNTTKVKGVFLRYSLRETELLDGKEIGLLGGEE